jgi:hypothetical protein
MSAWITTALAVAIGAMSAITSVNAGSCGPGSTPNCFNIPTTIDFGSVPEISKQIVSEEKPGQKQKQPTGEPPAAAPYKGPIFGASPRPGRTPVVGYSWSLVTPGAICQRYFALWGCLAEWQTSSLGYLTPTTSFILGDCGASCSSICSGPSGWG